MRLAFKTFGCRANSVDSEFLRAEATHRGFTIVSENEPADAYLVNSCTVTHVADKEARDQIRKFRKQSPASVIAIVGCYSQISPQQIAEQTSADIILGTANKSRALEAIHKTLCERTANTEQPQNLVDETNGFLPQKFLGTTRARATIKVQDGCNFRCSFCIIPVARGRSRSLPIATIASQVDEAYRAGHNEVVLTGIHLAHYGWDQGTDLAALVLKLLEKEKGPRMRLSSLDPFEIPDEILNLIGNHPRLCPYFHIALQSGSNRILRAMRRIYPVQDFEIITERIYSKYADTFVGVDIIAGFPGETEQEFDQTLRCLENTSWSQLHVFPYSGRPGTEAAALENAVDERRISERAKQLRGLSQNRHQQFLNSQIGKTRQMIVESPLKGKTPGWSGRTENYIHVQVPNTQLKRKEKISVRIDSITEDKALGYLVK